jgi:hypothetical protein
MTTHLYWIHCKEHTDVFSEGYVGVSKNIERRWKDHFIFAKNNHLKNAINKYGWDNLVKEIILIGEEKYCYDLEAKIRPTKKIGWNIAEGGANPPKQWGNTGPGLKKEKHPMFGKKRPDNAIRNKLMVFEGKNNGTYKGAIEAIDVNTKKVSIYHGAKELRLAGFCPSNVYNCINPNKPWNKTHKGHSFKRLEK